MRTTPEEYKKQTKLLIAEVYKILAQKGVPWDAEDEELYSLLEQVVFLKLHESSFVEFFKNIEGAIESAIRLDFSKRVPVVENLKEKSNVFNYAVLCLNVLMEKMETSVVSMKAVNTMLSTMEGTMMIVTNREGVIRFVNDLGEKTLGLKKNEYLGKSVYLLLDDHEQIRKEYLKAEQLTNRKVNLIVPGVEKKVVSVFLTIPKPYKEHTEIEEIVYSIAINNKQEKQFNIYRELHDKVAPLNTILAAADLLRKKVISKESKQCIDAIIKSAQIVKEDTSQTLMAMSSANVSTIEKYPVDISQIVEQTLASLKFNEGFNEIKFDVRVAHNKDFHADSKLLQSIFQNLISNAIKYRRKNNPEIYVFVSDITDSELQISIGDNGIGISIPDKQKIFDKAYQVSNSNPGYGIGLYLVKESVDRLKGSIEVQSKLGEGTTFHMCIPHSS